MKFTPEICEKLSYYVYRLIDPRNGETFYVGKGKGNRVFEHINNAVNTAENSNDDNEKLKRIREITGAGLEVIHIIHRYGLDEETAFEVEAAIIDCYPGLTNIKSGYCSERGVTNSEIIIKELGAAEYEEKHRRDENRIDGRSRYDRLYDRADLTAGKSLGQGGKARCRSFFTRSRLIGINAGDASTV